MFERCVDCEKMGKTCGGPDFYLMQADELIAWCKRRKEYLRLSNAKIAEAANMSRGTVDNLFANTHADFRYETIRPVLQVLISKTGVQDPCGATGDAEAARIKEEYERLQRENEQLKKELERERAQHEQDKGYLREQLKSLQVLVRTRKHIIYFLFAALMVILCAIIGVLIWDKMNPNIGWFRSLNIFGSNNITGGI